MHKNDEIPFIYYDLETCNITHLVVDERSMFANIHIHILANNLLKPGSHKMKEIFEKRTKPDDFHIGDMVLQWDAPHEEKGKHGKFDHLWKGSYKISEFRGNNAYVLEEMEGGLVYGAPVNDMLYKHFFCKTTQSHYHCIYRFLLF